MVELAKAQRQDPTLFPIHYLLESGKRDDTDYVLLWRAPRGWMYAIAVPRQLVPGMLVVRGVSIPWHSTDDTPDREEVPLAYF